MFSHEGPNKEQVCVICPCETHVMYKLILLMIFQLETTKFKTTMFGKGWRNKCIKAEETPEEPPQDHITCTVEGGGVLRKFLTIT